MNIEDLRFWMSGCRKKLPAPPVNGSGMTQVHGVWVHAAPLVGEAPKVERFGRTRAMKRSTHRLLAECPFCNKVLSAGRMHQHLPIHAEAK